MAPRRDFSHPAAPLETLTQISDEAAKLLKAEGMRPLTNQERQLVQQEIERVKRCNTQAKAARVDAIRQPTHWVPPEVELTVRHEMLDDPGAP